ncbi:heme-thiolate peroxidase [Hysterangium stoloniferum]|nr:heme-thiolate peroxidase [Hysterangium stoloniferum]
MGYWIVTASRNIAASLWSLLARIGGFILVFVWDTTLFTLNMITPRKQMDANWPEFLPPTVQDSRSCCPALNALRQVPFPIYCIFPRDGRGITFKQLGDEVHRYYNFSPSFCYFVCNFLAGILRRDYKNATLDLSDISVHNGIEHDGSLTRYDTFTHPDQSKPDEGLVNDLLSLSKDGKTITASDLSQAITTRMAHSKQTNGQFSLSTIHSFFAGNNAATLLLLFDGNIEDIKPFLIEERIPTGWSSKFRARFGLTMPTFNATTFRILFGIDPSWQKVKIQI